MKKKYTIFSIALCFVFLISYQNSNAQSPFNCVTEAYLFQHNDVYAQNLASGNAILDGINLTNEVINGVGYNDKDGYIWGSLKTSSGNNIVRVGNNYQVTVYTVPGASYSYVGDINMDGIYYLKSGGNSFYMIDLDPASQNYLTKIGTGILSQSIGNHDWAFNAADDMLYTVEKNSNILYKIDPTTGNVTALGEVPILSGLNYTYGAVYFDVAGNFYISANQTGTVYVVYAVQNVTSSLDMNSNIFAFGPSSSQNDGARCPTAPVPQEDCSNGVDDDGDGLVDCDDPACSGVASCPVISPTSTGNNGGLESNNRLTEDINQRNLNRLKNNYKFNVANAKRLYKNKMYGQKSTNQSTLWNYVPMNILPQTTAVESTPEDLTNITNAVDVLSVDYVNGNNQGVGTLLVLKTDNSVYEHTKHICDRFTGSELLSVNTMEINGANFIKSRVKRPDGGIEFVASFSVTDSADNQSFEVESHWNLDQYSDKGFYNFQVWASSIDDLYKLCEEVLRLVGVQKQITSYRSSDAPPVFIKKGKYERGKVYLEIVNVLGPTTVTIQGNKRTTETGNAEPISFNVELTDYLNKVQLDTQNLYDFGFRLSNVHDITPDDLFLSDGTWGVDYSSKPFLNNFTVSENVHAFHDDAYEVERNFTANFSANQNISIFRSLTPKFEQVDLSSYELMSFEASGTGRMKVTIVKESISEWEDQPSVTIDLTATQREYEIPYSDFTTPSNNSVILDDVKTLFFTLISDDAITEEKSLSVNDVHFVTRAVASVTEVEAKKITVGPNPVTKLTTLTFSANLAGKFEFEVYDIFGKQVYTETFAGNSGKNEIIFDRKNLASGLYFFKVSSDEGLWKGKVLLK